MKNRSRQRISSISHFSPETVLLQRWSC